jgi:hypothetical protein
VFISHSSANLADAKEIDAALDAAGFDPWLDHSDIRVGVLEKNCARGSRQAASWFYSGRK